MSILKNKMVKTSIIVLVAGFVVGSFTDPCVMLLVFFGWLAWTTLGSPKGNALVTFGNWIWGSFSIAILIVIAMSGCNLWKFESNLQTMASNSGLYYNCSAQVESLYENSSKLRTMIGGL